MKLKKLLALLLVAVMCLTLVACGNGKSGSSSPILYKVTDSSGNVCWLFGSIHIGREDYYPLPDYVLKAFDGSDALAVEFDIIAFEGDMTAQVNAMTEMMNPLGVKTSDCVDEEVYEAAKEILQKENQYYQLLDMYNPALWTNLIDNIIYTKLELDIEGGIDRHLINRAYDKNKKVLDVESAEFQYQMLAGYSDELQNFLLDASIEEYERIGTDKGKKEALAEFDEMIDAWVKGDTKAFERIMNETDFESKEEEILYEEYNKAMVTDRNITMADYAEDALKSGEEVFICVGAAHVIGDGAMADLLAERGYKVEIVK